MSKTVQAFTSKTNDFQTCHLDQITKKFAFFMSIFYFVFKKKPSNPVNLTLPLAQLLLNSFALVMNQA